MQKAHRSQISDIWTLHLTTASWNGMHGDLETAEGLREPTTTWRTCWAAVWPTWGSVCNCTAVTVPWARDKGPSPYYKLTNVTRILVKTHKNTPSMVLYHTEMLCYYILLHLWNSVLHYQILPVNFTHYLLLDLSTAGLHHYLLSTSCRCGGVLLHVCCLTSVGWAMRWNLSLKNSNNMLLISYATAHVSDERSLKDVWQNAGF